MSNNLTRPVSGWDDPGGSVFTRSREPLRSKQSNQFYGPAVQSEGFSDVWHDNLGVHRVCDARFRRYSLQTGIDSDGQGKRNGAKLLNRTRVPRLGTGLALLTLPKRSVTALGRAYRVLQDLDARRKIITKIKDPDPKIIRVSVPNVRISSYLF